MTRNECDHGQLRRSCQICDLVEERDAAVQQAQTWKQEARTQSATVAKIYQLCTGSKGEPGNWHGADPVRELVAERDALAAHVERIIREWNSGDDQFSDEWINRMGDIVEDAPETSLDRLKAQWQAEALEGVLACCEKCPPGKSHKDALRFVYQMTRAHRDLIRRQAGGDA